MMKRRKASARKHVEAPGHCYEIMPKQDLTRPIRPKHACQKVEPRVLWCLLIGCVMAEERNGGPVRCATSSEYCQGAANLSKTSTDELSRKNQLYVPR